jgi:serine/threonine protein kinase
VTMVGQTISHYSVIEKLGAGGMGEIYKAQDTRLNRFVAIKVLSAASVGDPEHRRRFIQEGQAASALNHPNIITIYDIVSQDALDCIVMEFIAGATLAECIPKEGMPLEQVLACAVQMADALRAAHAAGIIHRDLKPGNVMVTGSGLVKILDFGLAKLSFTTAVDPADETKPLHAPMTMEGSILGTVSYMSPEQAEGRRIDARSDIFSFGLVLYEMLTGAKAFGSGSAISTLAMILRDEARPISQVVRGIPPELELIVNRAMRKDPDHRWQSMQEMHAELLALKQRLDSVILMKPAAPLRKKSSALLPLAAIGAVVVIGLAFGVWWWENRAAAPIPAPPPPVARSTPPAATSGTASPAPSKASPPAPVPSEDSVLTNQAVLDMLQAKVPISVIVGQVRSAKTKFDLSTSEIILLSRNGATADLLEAMRNPKAAVPPVPSSAVSSVAPPASAPTVTIPGGIPLRIALTGNVPANPAAGQVLHFTVARDLRIGDSLVVARGTPLEGEIVDTGTAKVLLIRKSKATFRVSTVAASDGSNLTIRATPGRRADRVTASIEPPGHHDKDILAPAGAEYLVYVDGDQIVRVHH